jgi:hypothetical protein
MKSVSLCMSFHGWVRFLSFFTLLLTARAGEDSCPNKESNMKKVTHYHLHKTGGITINSILMSRYGGSQLHGPERPILSKALDSSHSSYFISYVRDPIAALLSRFFFWRACAVSKTYRLEADKERKVMCQTLDSYMRLEASHNFMFDSLITGAPLGRCRGNSTKRVFEKPPNLKKGATWRDVCFTTYEDFVYQIEHVLWGVRDRLFVGITERFDESLWLFGEQAGFSLGITDLKYCPKNLVIGGIKKSDLPPETLKMMENRNMLDMVLVEAAEKVLNRRRKCAGEGFESRFREFMSSLLQFQSKNNCSMAYLKSPQVSAAAKKKFKVEFLRPILADPNYVDSSNRKCQKAAAAAAASSSSSSSSPSSGSGSKRSIPVVGIHPQAPFSMMSKHAASN